MTAARPRAYLKSGCPFSFKLHVFLTEAGLAEDVEIVTVPLGSDLHHSLFAKVEATGRKPSFPMMEYEDGTLETESQAIIDRLATEHALGDKPLPLLDFYTSGMLPRFGKMFTELKRLKGADWNGEL